MGRALPTSVDLYSLPETTCSDQDCQKVIFEIISAPDNFQEPPERRNRSMSRRFPLFSHAAAPLTGSRGRRNSHSGACKPPFESNALLPGQLSRFSHCFQINERRTRMCGLLRPGPLPKYRISPTVVARVGAASRVWPTAERRGPRGRLKSGRFAHSGTQQKSAEIKFR
jgi:hypothetical protein